LIICRTGLEVAFYRIDAQAIGDVFGMVGDILAMQGEITQKVSGN